MKLEKFLLKQIQKRFVANAAIENLGKKIEDMAEMDTAKKYKNVPIFQDGLEYELIGVNASFDSLWANSIDFPNVELKLAYFCVSKLPKAKREILEKVKADYIINKPHHLDFCPYKVQIWKQLRYTINAEIVLSDSINLEI